MYDVLIAGGGYVGLTTAVAIAHAAPHMKIAVLDAAPESALEKDERASAIAAAATRMLTRLGVWQRLADDAQPINEMIVTDSRTNDAMRPIFLTFETPPESTEPYAHMLANKLLVRQLRIRASELGVELRHQCPAVAFERSAANVELELQGGERIAARLLVAADGRRSRLRDIAGIKTVDWPYGQSGIVTTVAHKRDHAGRAEEHFLPAGPFAILPLKNKRSSLVWTEREADADRILATDPISFELELEKRFGHHLGELTVEGPTRAFPLGLSLARAFVADRFALVGDAAHGIHPISGQGLNLGFKDAAALAEMIADAERLGLDIGSLAVLERYQMWRRFDTFRMGVVTDVLNRLFSNDNPILRIARDVGLGIVDRMPGLKRQFIDQAAGKAAGEPKLLRGEAV